MGYQHGKRGGGDVLSHAIQKSPDRLAVLERIEEYERKGWFSKDVEEDPPTVPLTADKVDYLRTKLSSKVMHFIVNRMAWSFIHRIIREKQMIIKAIEGFDNYISIENEGAILTCNHFNAFDNFAVHHALEKSLNRQHRDLYKVIREGNYTNFPGMYGLFFRHCDTLPLSANFNTMKHFMDAVSVLLQRGDKILVYAEQGMWWNYRKPRPLTSGAFTFAVENDSPVLPIFITMSDSNIIASDGFPVQEYTLHFLPAIRADKSLSAKHNIEAMRSLNYNMWKEVYERVYGIPLTYTTEGGVFER